MALTFTAGTPVESTGSVTSTTVTLPAGVGAGDYTIIIVALNASSGAITTPSGWTNILASTATVNGSTACKIAVFYRKWVSGDGSVAVTTSSGRVGAVAVRVQGADQTTFVDTTSSVSQLASSITTLTAPTITPGASSAWLMNVFGARSATNGVFLTPFTNLQAGITKAAETSGKATSQTNAAVLLTYDPVTPSTATGTRTADASAVTTGALAFSFTLNEAASGGPGDVTAVVATATSQEATPVVTGQVNIVHVKASGTAADIAPVVTAAATVTGVGAQASSLAPAPVVVGAQVANVAAVTATGSSLAVPPVVAGGSGVTAIAAQASSAAITPAVTAESIVISVRAQGTSTAIAPAVSNGAVNTYHLFLTTPQVGADSDTGSVNLGTEFYVTAPAWVTEVRYLQPATGGTSTSRVAAIWSTTDGNTGTMVAGPFTIPAPAAGTWGVFELPTPFELTPNTRYRISVRHPDGRYAATGGYFNAGGDGQTTLTQGILVRPNSTDALGNDQGSYEYNAANLFPINSFNAASYYSDITIVDAEPSGEANVSAVRAQASSAAIAPAVTAPHTVTAVRALASSTAIAPALAGAQTVAAVRAQASSLALAPVASGAQLLVAVRAQATSLAPAPAVSAAGAATVSSPAMLATADAIEPYVSGGGPANVGAVVATASGDMLEPVVSVIATVAAVKAGATSGAVAPVAQGAVSVQSVRSVATAVATVPAVEVLALIAAVNMTAAALHRAPALSLEAITLAVFSTATAMMLAPKVGNTSELYLKDGTRLLPYMLSGGILIPVDPQF